MCLLSEDIKFDLILLDNFKLPCARENFTSPSEDLISVFHLKYQGSFSSQTITPLGPLKTGSIEIGLR